MRDSARLPVVLFDRVGDILRSTCNRHNVLRDLAHICNDDGIGLDSD